MPGFVQVIEWSTCRIDEVRALADERRAELEASGDGPVRISIVADRHRPNRYMAMVEFRSYEQAMRNSSRADTNRFASRMAALCDGPPVFRDLDVLDTYVNTAAQRTPAPV